jgi:hypothetical protein
LEANPNPQIAHKEDFADSAEHSGIPYDQLLQKIITVGLNYAGPRLSFKAHPQITQITQTFLCNRGTYHP